MGIIIASLVFSRPEVSAQDCPYNIDFETGDFTGWTCYTGFTSAGNGTNIISLTPSGGPIPGRHTMLSANPGNGADPYGGFPMNCPNGSGHSIMLGNNTGGAEAEGISYTFTIPSNKNIYSLIYHYAVVFQDPAHLPNEQPRMEIEITNVTDNTIIYCSSFTFFPNGSLLPGFFLSPNPGDTTAVWCKDWSAVSINLDGNAGKTIQLFFKTADCTFRRHFGYAYIDVNSECSGEFVGATFCPDDTAVNVVAPYGYETYTWYNPAFTQVLGTGQTITFNPPPPPNTTIAVELVPYFGYGCLDTLYARLIDTLTVHSNAGRDALSCNQSPVQIGGLPKPGLVYRWTPVTGLSNPNISNPLASPNVTTMYILTTNHDGGGCIDKDTVVVTASTVSATVDLLGKPTFCEGFGDSAVLIASASGTIQWFKDGTSIPGATQPRYQALQSGSYFAMVSNADGCSIATPTQNILIDRAKPGIRYPLQYALVDYPLELAARQFGTVISWNPPIYLDNRTIYNPNFRGAGDQEYTITITTSTGCVTTDTQLVKTVKSVEIYVPKAFTPNGDALNDFLRPIPMGIKQLTYFRIYNRWGRLLYQSSTDQPGWNGMYNGTLQPSQVVVWIAEGIGVDNRVYQRKGTSVLIR